MSRPGRACVAAVTVAAMLVGAPGADGARLPRIEVDVRGEIRDEPKVPGTLEAFSRRGRRTARTRIGIEIRGEGSQHHRKRQFDLETRTADGKNRNIRLLGLPKGNDWVLRAAHVDPTLLRDALAFRTARRTGRYAPRTRHVELRVDGDYRGVYLLVEEPRLDAARVDAEALLELSVMERLDREDRPFQLPVTGRHVRVVDIDEEVDENALAGHVQGFERLLYGGGDEWRTRLDVSAAVDYALLQELFRNQDGFVSSTYFHVDSADGRIVLGPAWDFDLSSGNVSRPEEAPPEGWLLDDKPWMQRLYAEPDFRAAMAERWRAWRRTGVVDDLVEGTSRESHRLVRPLTRNHRKWRLLGRPIFTGQTAYPTYFDAVGGLRVWLTERAAWLDRALAP